MASAAESHATIPGQTTIASLPTGGFRQCLKHPAMLVRWFLSRRFRHAVEVRKHVWKIRCFQADALAPNALANIDDGIRAFDRLLISNPNDEAIANGLKELDVCAQKWLQPYANAAIRENVEVFLVAIGVAMAIRTFVPSRSKSPRARCSPRCSGCISRTLEIVLTSPCPGFWDAATRPSFAAISTTN
jgi:hypothetical protein